jgi:hypothetical protein
MAYVTMTDLSEVMPLLQKNKDINETVWNSLGGKSYTKFCSGAQTFRIGTQQMLYYWPIVCTIRRYLFLTIITVQYKIRKNIGQ